MTTLPTELLDELRRHDTPTICNGLEVLDDRHRNGCYTTLPFVARDPALPPIVGYARTVTIRSMRPPAGVGAEAAAKRLAYYEYIAMGPKPAIVVLQDLDTPGGTGAFWGEVQTTVHQALGCVGGITNGAMRDIAAMAPGFQVLAGLLAPSHAHVHVVATDGVVTVHGLTVRPGDLIHADNHGAVVIPHERAPALPAAIAVVMKRERLLLEAARRPGFSVADIRAALAAAADIH
ncbi:MAG: RraA family protein [Alphaproteobacteria bacterium]|nr:RraA family protein [Alphaproteobacteria bacterium]